MNPSGRSSSAPARKPRPCFLISPKQAAFLDSREPVRGFVGGQGSGKSLVGAYDLLQRALDGRTYLITGPTYKMLAQATVRTFVEVARRLDRLVRVTRSLDNPSAIIRPAPPRRGLAEVLFRSTENPDLLRGPNLSGLWMDEASLSPLEAYQIGTARLREGGQCGWLSATFTPQGLTHWTFEQFGTGKPGVFLVRAGTRDNPFLSPEFLELVGRTYVGLRARQELEGEFVQVAGAEWPAEYFPPSVMVPPAGWPESWRVCALALDPALGRGERGGCYAAFAFCGVDAAGFLWADAWLSQCWDADQLVSMGLDLLARTRAQALAIEINGGQEFLARLFLAESRRRNVPVPLYAINNVTDKEVRIRATLTPFLAQGRLRFNDDSPGGKLLVGQLRDFPIAAYRDAPDALQMAIVTCNHLLGQAPGGAVPRAVS